MHGFTRKPRTEAEAAFEQGEEFAIQMDSGDPLGHFRQRFHVPLKSDGSDAIYFCGNSLGLMPKSARALVEEELEDWKDLAVDAHFHGRRPWYSYHEMFRDSGARLVGARPGEVVMMNSLTVNLHLMMVSFFRPTAERFRIVIDWPCFPSDLYAVKSHLRSRRLDPDDALLIARPRAGEHTLRTDDLVGMLDEHGDTIGLVLLAGVNFFTGQMMDMAALTEAAHRRGCVIGFDLAHAAGNIAMQLHDWDVDFACWCSYKYLNAGPGAVAGCFIHEHHAQRADLPRYAGWWGNDPEQRFRMHTEERFLPKRDADGWQLSNPPILSTAPLRASLDIFDEAGMDALQQKSRRLTGYLHWLLEREMPRDVEIITPSEPAAHGCQLSLLVRNDPAVRRARLREAGIICDFREPNVLRIAPVPLYNTYLDVWQFVQNLKQH